jgi:hypothetical protein
MSSPRFDGFLLDIDELMLLRILTHSYSCDSTRYCLSRSYLPLAGANNSIQHAAVKYILDTVVEELLKDPQRKFIYVEQAFFQMWWVRQPAEIQANVKTLVANGQLEFINGGWCMHDEANTHYLDMIDQTTLGHQFILQEFGVTPKIGWQVSADGNGHTSTQHTHTSITSGDPEQRTCSQRCGPRPTDKPRIDTTLMLVCEAQP